MDTSNQTREDSLKQIRNLCFAIGSYYALTGLLSIAVIRFELWLFRFAETSSGEPFPFPIEEMFNGWEKIMPWIIILGMAYIAFGLVLPRYRAHAFNLNLGLGLVSAAWAYIYSHQIIGFIHRLVSGFEEFPEARPVLLVIYAFIGISAFALFLGPQFVLGWKIRKMEKETPA